jgi:transcriptional regulator with PAS, ATPase and Fis domain
MVRFRSKDIKETQIRVRSTSNVTRVVEQPGQLDTLQVRRARLEVVRGPDKGLCKDVHHLHVVVGTSSRCDMVLTDQSVSRRHFELGPGDNGYVLRDLDSMNGTFIRGLRVREVLLPGSEEIEIGRSTLLLSTLDEHEELPLSDKTAFGTMVGRSAAMRQVFAVLERAAPSDATILLEGESGTGKELAAENIHSHSPYHDKPFILVDCGAVAPSLVESELFGHCKGAFTGADRDRAGAFEEARGGTVFLDEISEVNLSIQPKLLRLLDKREIKRVGENRYRPAKARIIAASNRDLTNEVEQGRFREDLFYRLSVVRVRLPPLRDRRDDIGLLAREFITKRHPDMDPNKVVTDQVTSMFLNHDWPGNVRELRNVVERLLLFPEQPESAIRRGKSPVEEETFLGNMLEMPFRKFQQKLKEHYEKAYLSAILDSCNGVMSWAAKKAGLPRQTFYRLVAKYKLKK